MSAPARNPILQSAGLASRYPTLGKFVLGASQTAAPPASPATPAPPAPLAPSALPPSPPPAADADLELLDNLVATTLLNRAQDQAAVSAPPPSPTGARQKELLELQPAPADSAPEVSAEATPEIAVEAAPSAESPELQELAAELREVSKETKEQREQAEIKEKQAALSELAKTATTPVSVSDKPVVVLPITAKSKEEARFKSPKYSVVWLWEWCKKIAKIFDGAVVYKEEVENPPAA